MTPEQKIKHLILAKIFEWKGEPLPQVTSDNIDDVYTEIEDDSGCYDAMEQVRSGEVETRLPCPYSRHYEAISVAAKTPDGSWVGWTYWYGGGKHGEPEAIEWMNEAYDLTCVEEEKMVIVRTFTKI